MLQRERTEFTNERLRIHQEVKKLGARYEEEVELRLFFEAKLNSLHCVNRESESGLKLTEELREKLAAENAQLRKDNLLLINQNIDYKAYKERLQDKVWTL